MKHIWFKVRIKSCCDKDYWYADKIGDVIIVRKTSWDGWGFEHKSGSSVFRHDVVPIAKVWSGGYNKRHWMNSK